MVDEVKAQHLFKRIQSTAERTLIVDTSNTYWWPTVQELMESNRVRLLGSIKVEGYSVDSFSTSICKGQFQEGDPCADFDTPENDHHTRCEGEMIVSAESCTCSALNAPCPCCENGWIECSDCGWSPNKPANVMTFEKMRKMPEEWVAGDGDREQETDRQASAQGRKATAPQAPDDPAGAGRG